MISVNVKGMAEMQSTLRNLAKEQLPYAMATAINATAFKVRGALQSEMKSVFQNPTPWIQKSVRYEKATKENLTAKVYHHEEGAKSIISEVRGGQREVKPYERLMRSAGILPAGRLVVPGAACRLDRYGSIDKDVLAAILKSLGLLSAKMQQGRKVTKKRVKALNQSGTYFVGGQGLARHLAPGIWQRVGGRPRPILLFVTRSVYSKRYQFDVVGEREVRKVFANEMARAVQKAIDTAR